MTGHWDSNHVFVAIYNIESTHTEKNVKLLNSWHSTNILKNNRETER